LAVSTGSYEQLRAVTRSYKQLRAVASSYEQLRAVTSSYKQLLAVTSSYKPLLKCIQRPEEPGANRQLLSRTGANRLLLSIGNSKGNSIGNSIANAIGNTIQKTCLNKVQQLLKRVTNIIKYGSQGPQGLWTMGQGPQGPGPKQNKKTLLLALVCVTRFVRGFWMSQKLIMYIHDKLVYLYIYVVDFRQC